MIDKLTIGLIADVLHAKGVINSSELEGMYDIKTVADLDPFTEKITRGGFGAQRRGEHYTSTKA